MNKKIEELQNTYITNSLDNQSAAYAQMGAAGVSPAHLKMYEDSMNKLRVHNEGRQQKERAYGN